jgi:hypothetical protein
MADKRSHARGPGKTSITLSVTEAFRDEIDEAAREENRTRSNWIVTVLAKKIAEAKAQQALEAGAPKGANFPSTARATAPGPFSVNESEPPVAARATSPSPQSPVEKYTRIRATAINALWAGFGFMVGLTLAWAICKAFN